MENNEQFINLLTQAFQKIGTMHCVGDEWHSITGRIPLGGIPYCGQELQRAAYPGLWDFVQKNEQVITDEQWQSYSSSQSGNVPYYSSGDGSTTFRMPAVVGYIKGANSQSQAGQYVEQGLPNITGRVYNSNIAQRQSDTTGLNIQEGAFTVTQEYGTSGGAWNYSLGGTYNFDASRSNTIYGNSIDVTPKTMHILFGVYGFGVTANIGSLDCIKLAGDVVALQTNINSKLDNSKLHIVEFSSSGTQWYKKYSNGWVEQGGHFGVGANATTISLVKPFANTNYQLVATQSKTTTAIGSQGYLQFYNKTTTSFQIHWGANQGDSWDWIACGFGG